MEQELKETTKELTKEERSRNMNLEHQQTERQVNIGNASSELTEVSQKHEERKVAPAEIEYLVTEFAMNRNKAANLLRKMDLKQALRYLVHS